MKAKEIRDLLHYIASFGLGEVKIETDEFKIHVKRAGGSSKSVDLAHVEEDEEEAEEIVPVAVPAPEPKEGDVQTFTANGVSFEMIYIAPGEFMMGDEVGDLDSNFRPVHRVRLGGYWMAKYPVTQRLYQAVTRKNPSEFTGNEERPVERVCWNDAQAFIKQLNALAGDGFRLPTEAEWEYAARGGAKSRGYRYAGSNELGEVAWYLDNSGKQTYPVGQKKGNELGLYDMSGNTFEWCKDWYASDYYARSPLDNPKGADNGNRRVVRGGSWFGDGDYCRVACRRSNDPANFNVNIGFRVCRGL